MDRGVAQTVRNFSEIQLIAADELLGCIDLHSNEEIHDPAAVGIMENFLKL